MMGTPGQRTMVAIRRIGAHVLIEELDGLIAGLLVCPELITPGDWLPIVWGLDQENRQSVFDDVDHANRVMGLVRTRSRR